jgi:hypothetical protein
MKNKITSPSLDSELPAYVSSLDDLSATTGLSRRSWQDYTGREGFPIKTKKGYDVAAVLSWYRANVVPNRKSGAGEGGELKAKKLEKLDEEIALLRIKRAKEEGRVVSVDAIADATLRAVTATRQTLDQVFLHELLIAMEGKDITERRAMIRGGIDRVCAQMGALSEIKPINEN